MKKIIYVLASLVLTFFALSTTNAQERKAKYEINQDKIDIPFTYDYKLTDLTMVKAQLDSLGIKLEYTSMKFDAEGYLTQISASIQYPDGTKGSFVSRELQKGDCPGFKRDLIAKKN